MKEFPIEDGANGAEYTEKKRPDVDVGNRHTCVVISAAYKGWTCMEAVSMVQHQASKSFATDLEGNTRGAKGASELDQV